jgi:CubicO group peptidase (beta-lactamase class C family)
MKFSCFAFFLLSASAWGQSEGLSPAAAGLAQGVERAGSRLAAGGMVAAYAQNGDVRYFAAGRPTPSAGIPPERMIFEVGSIGKVFTGLLLAQAVVEHKVALADPIRRYLPESVVLDPAIGAITLEQLATHTSGLPRAPGNLRPVDLASPYAGYTVEDLYAFLRTCRPSGPAPHPADYSNLGMGLLAHVLELAYHEPYGQLLAEKIAGPLLLPDTGTALNDEQQSRLAGPHLGSRSLISVSLPTSFAGAVGLYSTAADLVRLTHVLGLKFDHPLQAAWELARQPRRDFPALGGRIGLGVLIMERGGATIYWHGGTTTGSRSHLEWSPQDGRAEVVLMNSDSVEAMNLAVTLYQLKVGQ